MWDAPARRSWDAIKLEDVLHDESGQPLPAEALRRLTESVTGRIERCFKNCDSIRHLQQHEEFNTFLLAISDEHVALKLCSDGLWKANLLAWKLMRRKQNTMKKVRWRLKLSGILTEQIITTQKQRRSRQPTSSAPIETADLAARKKQRVSRSMLTSKKR